MKTAHKLSGVTKIRQNLFNNKLSIWKLASLTQRVKRNLMAKAQYISKLPFTQNSVISLSILRKKISQRRATGTIQNQNNIYKMYRIKSYEIK